MGIDQNAYIYLWVWIKMHTSTNGYGSKCIQLPMVYAFGEYEFLWCYKCKHCLESLPCNLALKNLASIPDFAFFFKKWASFVFSIQWTVNKFSILSFANDWIWTVDLWCRKRPLYQLSHNHGPYLPKQFITEKMYKRHNKKGHWMSLRSLEESDQKSNKVCGMLLH